MLGLGPPAYVDMGVDDGRAAVDLHERALGAGFLQQDRPNAPAARHPDPDNEHAVPRGS